MPNQKLERQFVLRLALFVSGERGKPINDHALGGNKLGLRAFSITGDIRVTYIEDQNEIIFIDIGTHNQIY